MTDTELRDLTRDVHSAVLKLGVAARETDARTCQAVRVIEDELLALAGYHRWVLQPYTRRPTGDEVSAEVASMAHEQQPRHYFHVRPAHINCQVCGQLRATPVHFDPKGLKVVPA